MKLKTPALLCLASAALLLALAGGLWWLDAAGNQAVADAKVRIRAAGLPLTIDEIRPPRVPDADNAALVIEKIKQRLEAPPKIDGKDLEEWLGDFKVAHASVYRLDANATRELAAALDANPVRDVLELIQEAASRKGYNAQLDYGKGVAMLVPNVAYVGRMARLLGWHARLSASRGQTEAACCDVWNMSVLAEFMADEPTLISQLSRWAGWRMTLNELEQLASAGSLSAAWDQKFTDRLAGLDFIHSYAHALDGERILSGSMSFERILALADGHAFLAGFGTVPDWPAWLRIMRYQIPGLLRLEYADFLDRERQMRLVAVQTSPGDAEIIRQQKNARGEVPPKYLLMSNLLGEYSNMTAALWKFRAMLVSAQAGLALERYRLAKGRYPATLAELVPEFMHEVPTDIFTGTPLIYHPEPGGAVVYSIGPNLDDDGGIADNQTGKDDQGWAAGAAAPRIFALSPKPVTEPETKP